MNDATNMVASPDYIRSLAKFHDSAAAAFKAANSAVAGLAETVSTTHTTYADASKAALARAEAAHTKLAAAMQNYSTGIAAWLRQAADAYEGADQLAAENLRKQVISD